MQHLLKPIKTLLILCPLFFLSACGFHLKHNDGLVEKYPKIILQSAPNSDLTRLVKLRLRGAGIEIVTASSILAEPTDKIIPESSDEITAELAAESSDEIAPDPFKNIAILKIGAERRSTRTISLYVNAQNAEQELSYNLSYSIQSSGYEAQNFTVNLYRDFLDNPSQALAKSREAELLTKELRTIAADHIINTMLSLENDNSKKVIAEEPDNKNELIKKETD